MATSDNDIFYLLADNTIGGEDDSADREVWIILIDDEFWHVVWSEDEAQEFIDMNDFVGNSAKVMYSGTVKPV